MQEQKVKLQLLKLLAKQYPSIDAASTEIINLKAILNLPKATEHFVSDIHGEYESFQHVLHNGSGVLKAKIDKLFGKELSASSRRALATLVYYPEKRIERRESADRNIEEWYGINLLRIIRITKSICSKYTRSKVRKALPKEYAYIMEELLNEQVDAPNKEEYYDEIIRTIIDLGKAKDIMCAFCYLIQRLAVDRLHIIGDIFDRGPSADKVMESIMAYHSVDIQWGNHDILWMGAASGNTACIANAIRIGCRYDNLTSLEDGYGINLLPLATFALEHYKRCNCEVFVPSGQLRKDDMEHRLVTMMHKAITIIQFKLEGQLVEEYPDFKLENRKLLHLIDYDKKTITLEGVVYPLLDGDFPTIDPNNPYVLTEGELQVMEKLKASFVNSDKLQRHIKFLFQRGSMYKVYNGNLLYHGCILLDAQGEMEESTVNGRAYKGKVYLDRLERVVRDGYFKPVGDTKKARGEAMMWYLWCGDKSPLFGKEKMATFERYFVADKATHVEKKNAYYDYLDDKEVAQKILKEFGVCEIDGHIINGHVPVKIRKGENPIKAGGKIIVIDGGFTRAYQKITGIAGYTLIYDSYGIKLASHMPFDGIEEAIAVEKDIVTTVDIVETMASRKRVRDTHIGEEIQSQIDALLLLSQCYKNGVIKEK